MSKITMKIIMCRLGIRIKNNSHPKIMLDKPTLTKLMAGNEIMFKNLKLLLQRLILQKIKKLI